MKLEKWFAQKLEEFKDDVEFRTEEAILGITEKIVELMEKEGINRTDLAKRLGVSKPFITKLLNGNPNMRLKTMVSLAMALNHELNFSFVHRSEQRQVTTPIGISDYEFISEAFREKDLKKYRKYEGMKYNHEDPAAAA